MAELYPGSLTDVPGLRMGHAQDESALTGCTVILCPSEGAIGGVSVRGLAPGTRETDLLRPGTLVERVHAILLTGGSAFGLAAADGMMRYLEEQGIGFDAGAARVPIVPAAVLFDLGLGNPHVRPDAAMGYAACEDAAGMPPGGFRTSERFWAQGNVGAGMGATVGKALGMRQATKGGLGMASLRAGELVVAALVAVNAFGDVRDPSTGQIVAGVRRPDGRGWADATSLLGITSLTALHGNTVIGVVATNGQFDVAQTNELAVAGHDGLARTIYPAHTLYDGDTLFALSTGQVAARFVVAAALAAEVVARAVLNAIWAARAAGGVPAAGE